MAIVLEKSAAPEPGRYQDSDGVILTIRVARNPAVASTSIAVSAFSMGQSPWMAVQGRWS